jgi:hypothetical protein
VPERGQACVDMLKSVARLTVRLGVVSATGWENQRRLGVGSGLVPDGRELKDK